MALQPKIYECTKLVYLEKWAFEGPKTSCYEPGQRVVAKQSTVTCSKQQAQSAHQQPHPSTCTPSSNLSIRPEPLVLHQSSDGPVVRTLHKHLSCKHRQTRRITTCFAVFLRPLMCRGVSSNLTRCVYLFAPTLVMFFFLVFLFHSVYSIYMIFDGRRRVLLTISKTTRVID